jgi:methionine-rich copper-binding protein CopC
MVALLVALAVCSAVPPALAHAQLLASNPAVGSSTKAFPKLITLTFDDDLVDLPGGNQIVVVDPKKKPVQQGETVLEGSRISVKLRPSKRYGKYTVTYRVISADGHPVTAQFPFYFVRKSAKN